MNNLLRTLTESHARLNAQDTNLKLLLTTVKEGRRQSVDAKLLDPFYDSLEGLLIDLRTVTIDNHDAEPFLKPVVKAEVPDYYDVIPNPMDLQTMLKKVKQKSYKSKREFQDDLDLIWANCHAYNAPETHPIRRSAVRLKAKAEKLLRHITDRKERTDPVIPADLAAGRPKVNGFAPPLNGVPTVNGHVRAPPIALPKVATAVQPKRAPRRGVPFPDSAAIVRTQEGMQLFQQLDQQLGSQLNSRDQYGLSERLAQIALPDQDDFEELSAGADNHELGEKRRLAGTSDHRRPHKRPRLTATSDIVDLWWGAVQSDTLIGNGLPAIAHPSSSPRSVSTKSRGKRKRRKTAPGPAPKSLLSLMNNNIHTMKRVRRTHAKFAALAVNNTGNNEDGDGPGADAAGAGIGAGIADAEEDEAAALEDDKVDERPWRLPGRVGGIEIGEESAADCVQWMSGKVLEHAGFQGASRVSLDVLTSVASEYLLNVGRTIRYLCDKYSDSMSAEEIILHTLFESGSSKIQDLERYISDDVERYGARLSDLEKKLVSAYRETTLVEALDDGALFGDEADEEDGGAFVMGDFADAFGEDFLGLRELGIAAEHGLSSLRIPKRLLKGTPAGATAHAASAAAPAAPPLPFPLPPPFVPLTAARVDAQIGLLRPYYTSRLAGAPGDALPDDAPGAAQAKMGPLGQIVRAGPAGGAGKKKGKAREGADGAGGGGPGGASGEAPAPKKKKGATGVGTGNGRKKKAIEMALAQQQGAVLPPAVVAGA